MAGFVYYLGKRLNSMRSQVSKLVGGNTHALDARALSRAFGTPLGKLLLDIERGRLVSLLDEYRGTKILHLSVCPNGAPKAPSPFRTITYAYPGGTSGSIEFTEQTIVEANFDALPFVAEQFDIVIVQHVLEFTEKPQRAIKEAARVTKPLGHMIVFAFNPVSMSGVVSAVLKRLRSNSLSNRRALFEFRLRDWLDFVDFNHLQTVSLGHCLPINSPKFAAINAKFASVLGRLNAPFSSVRCLIARKDQFNVLLSQSRWQKMRASSALFVPSPTATTQIANGNTARNI